MHKINLSDKDVMLIDAALRMFRMSVAHVRDGWRNEDLMDLVELSDEFTRLAYDDAIEREITRAEDQNRRK